jgi:hypothetical protein
VLVRTSTSVYIRENRACEHKERASTPIKRHKHSADTSRCSNHSLQMPTAVVGLQNECSNMEPVSKMPCQSAPLREPIKQDPNHSEIYKGRGRFHANPASHPSTIVSWQRSRAGEAKCGNRKVISIANIVLLLVWRQYKVARLVLLHGGSMKHGTLPQLVDQA